MRRRSIVATLILMLALALPAAVAADDPPAPTTRHQFRTAGLPVAGQAEVVTFIFETQPGAATPAHTHPGLVLVTVIEGALTFRTGGAERVYQVGESFIELPGVEGTALNLGAARSRATGSMVIPKGAAPSTPQPGAAVPAPAPASLYLSRADAALPAAPYEVAQTVLDFAPGAQTPVHTHPGQVFVTVIEGELTFRTGGADKVYKVGESFIEQPGVPAQARNAGATRATVMATYLLPQGAPLSAPAAMPGLPNTGAGGGDIGVPLGWLVLLVGGALVGGDRLLRRGARRA